MTCLYRMFVLSVRPLCPSLINARRYAVTMHQSVLLQYYDDTRRNTEADGMTVNFVYRREKHLRKRISLIKEKPINTRNPKSPIVHNSLSKTYVNVGRGAVSRQHLSFLWSPYGIEQTIIFLPCGFYLSSFFFLFSSPNLSGRTLDVYYTSTHGVALVRI